jgi:hypothetical protein
VNVAVSLIQETYLRYLSAGTAEARNSTMKPRAQP